MDLTFNFGTDRVTRIGGYLLYRVKAQSPLIVSARLSRLEGVGGRCKGDRDGDQIASPNSPSRCWSRYIRSHGV